MFFDVGMSPLLSLLIVTLVFAILSDFLLELFSVRMSLSTGRFQVWLFDRFGQILFLDFVFSIFFQFFSLRKKSFLVHMASIANVGSFSRRQIIFVSMGGLVGVGLSILLALGGHWGVGLFFCLLSLVLALLSKDQIKDFGFALFALGLFLISLNLFNEFLVDSSFSVHQYQFQWGFGLILIVMSTVLFRTPVAFLIFLGIFNHFVGIHIFWISAFFFLNSLLSSSRFYYNILKGQKRLYFFLGTVFLLQLLQFLVSLLLIPQSAQFVEPVLAFIGQAGFLKSFQSILLYYFMYHSLSLILVAPLAFLITRLPVFNDGDVVKSGSQKIILDHNRGSCFSIHWSLFLLRQEFKKYTTSVHTIFKISREADDGEEEINQKFARYQAILIRVGDELKELCFSIGRQRSYRWQVKEVMSYYRYVNQLELLVDDLGVVTALLCEEGQSEEWEKDCRFWLALQLKIFESFFNYTVGVGKDDWNKVQANIEKSYELLDRFFGENQNPKLKKSSSQTFYRITESIGNLAR